MGVRHVELKRWFSGISRDERFFVVTFLKRKATGRHSKITSKYDTEHATTCDEKVFVARKHEALGSSSFFSRQIRRKESEGHGWMVEGHTPDLHFPIAEGERF
jgi:hypothetical protein